MRELRIMLPDELWSKFQGQSPQRMKSAISTVICLQFQVMPEPKQRKPSNSGHNHRGNGGRFTGKPFTGVTAPLQEQETPNVERLVQRVPPITLEPETPRENTAQRPKTPPKITAQTPEKPPITSLESEAGQCNIKKLHPSYAVGLKAS